jgi:hypothetical protein
MNDKKETMSEKEFKSRKKEAQYIKTKNFMENCPKVNRRELQEAGYPDWAIREVCREKKIKPSEWGEPDSECDKKIKPSKKIFCKTQGIYKKYIDASELNNFLLSIWTLGTPFHSQFETYPILILGGRKQSGKTRTLKLISTLSSGSDGSVSTSITETHLFRHKDGAMFFDEMESLSSKEKTSLRELINAVYKRGNKIVRYREIKKDGVKDYVEECFYPFYPLALANIYGFGDVLCDRGLQLVLQRSFKSQTKLIEDFATNPEILALKNELSQIDATIPKNIFSEWNRFVETGIVLGELKNIFESISQTKLLGRPLEIFFPLFVVADLFGVLPELINFSGQYMTQLEGEFLDSADDLLQSFMESSKYGGFVKSSKILSDFRASLEQPEDWINSKWLGRALKRLGLIEKKRLINGCVEVKLNNNSTNSTNTINTTNTTNSTNKPVELVDFVDKIGVVEHIERGGEKNSQSSSKINPVHENVTVLPFSAKPLNPNKDRDAKEGS